MSSSLVLAVVSGALFVALLATFAIGIRSEPTGHEDVPFGPRLAPAVPAVPAAWSPPPAVPYCMGRAVFVEFRADRIVVDLMPDPPATGDHCELAQPLALELARPSILLLATAAEGVLQRWAAGNQLVIVRFELTDHGGRYDLRDGETRLVLDAATWDHSGR